MLSITEIETVFQSGNRQQIEMMARNILVHGRSHRQMHELSRHAEKFSRLLATTNPADRDYLALVYIMAQHLIDICHGACACSIVYQPMFNSPDRLTGILEVIEEEFDLVNYVDRVYSKCLHCGKKYESVMMESGFGQKVVWKEVL
jgi:hypothetical protein